MRKLKFSAGTKFKYSREITSQPSLSQVSLIAATAGETFALVGGHALCAWEFASGKRTDTTAATGYGTIDLFGDPAGFETKFACFGVEILSSGSEGHVKLSAWIRIDDEEFLVRVVSSPPGSDTFGPLEMTTVPIDGRIIQCLEPVSLLGWSVAELYQRGADGFTNSTELKTVLGCIPIAHGFISRTLAANADAGLELVEWVLEGILLPDSMKTLIAGRVPILDAVPFEMIRKISRDDASVETIRRRALEALEREREARRVLWDGSATIIE